MTINWTQDEHGNRDFIHEGWSVRIWALENSGLFRDKGVNRIHVEPPARSRWCADEVDVYDKGISVGSGGYNSGRGLVDPLTIPWAVLEAIFDARKIVTQELERT